MSSRAVEPPSSAEGKATAPARRPFLRPYPRSWWLLRRSYFLFLLRELTSLFVGAYCVFLLYALWQLGQGPDAYAALLELLRSPASVAAHAVVLLFVLYHAVTWFNLTPKIMVLRVGEEEVTPLLVAGLAYGGWILVSVLMSWLVLRA